MGANGGGPFPTQCRKLVYRIRELLGKADKTHRGAAPLAMPGAWLPLPLGVGSLPALPGSSLFSVCVEVCKQIYSLLCLD